MSAIGIGEASVAFCRKLVSQGPPGIKAKKGSVLDGPGEGIRTLKLQTVFVVGKDLADYVSPARTVTRARFSRDVGKYSLGGWSTWGWCSAISGGRQPEISGVPESRKDHSENMRQENGSWFERYAIVTRTDISNVKRKLEAHERGHVTEKCHVFCHSDNVDGQFAKGRIIN